MMLQPPSLPRHQRRQARPVDRVATRWHTCARRINLLPFPPHPPIERLCAGRERRGSKRGQTIGFNNARTWRHLRKPVDRLVYHHHLPHGTKASARCAIFENPRNWCFDPRIWLFYPHTRFLCCTLLSISISFFLKERDKKDRGGHAKTQSTGEIYCNKVYPRVFFEIRMIPWMAVNAKPSIHAGYSPIWRAIHHPRAEMPVCLPQALAGGLDHD